ncbi:MAG: hypothetical protein ACNA8W_23215, partial [Bradymonadaceae bacterium]
EISEGSEILIDAQAWLYLDADDGAERIRVMELTDELPPRDDLLLRFELVADRGEYIEVRTPGKQAAWRGCSYLSGIQEQRLRLTFFVKRDALQPVITKTLTLRHEDGTGYTLHPGVALIPTENEGRYRVQIGPVIFEVLVDDDFIGASFTSIDGSDGWRGTHLVDWSTVLRLGDEPVQIDPMAGTRYTPPSPVQDVPDMVATGPLAHLFWEKLYVSFVEGSDTVAHESACGMVWLGVARSSIEPDVQATAGILAAISSMMGAITHLRIDDGAPLFHPDGRPMGYVEEGATAMIPNFENVMEEKGLLCRRYLFFDTYRLREYLTPIEERQLLHCWRTEDTKLKIGDDANPWAHFEGGGLSATPSVEDAGTRTRPRPQIYREYADDLSILESLRIIQCEREQSQACDWLSDRCAEDVTWACEVGERIASTDVEKAPSVEP